VRKTKNDPYETPRSARTRRAPPKVPPCPPSCLTASVKNSVQGLRETTSVRQCVSTCLGSRTLPLLQLFCDAKEMRKEPGAREASLLRHPSYKKDAGSLFGLTNSDRAGCLSFCPRTAISIIAGKLLVLFVLEITSLAQAGAAANPWAPVASSVLLSSPPLRCSRTRKTIDAPRIIAEIPPES